MGRIRDNQHGFTIVEAIIGMLLASGLAVTVATVVDMSAKAERNASIGAERVELIGVLRQLITPAASCTANLKDIEVKTAEPYTPTNVELYYTKQDPMNPAEAVKDKLVLTGERFGKIDKVKFSVQLQALVNDKTWLAKVFIEGEKTGTTLGGKDIYGNVSTQVEVDAGKIIRCISEPNITLALTQNDPAMNEKICNISSGGVKAYDPVTNTCKDLATCYRGSADFAACPTGTLLVKGNYERHTDPMTFPRAFVGLADPQLVHPTSGSAVPNFTNNTVNCYWAVGVVPASDSCEACCRPAF